MIFKTKKIKMKNKLVFSMLLLFVVSSLLSTIGTKEARKLAETDKYKVIKVDGRIIFQRTNATMKSGDVFISGTLLDFVSPQSRAAVISSLKGRFVLSAAEKGQTKILPAANNISSRSGALINLIDLQNHFTGDYLVLDEVALEIGRENFPMDESHFFYLSYAYEGEKIRKKLDYTENNQLIISKNEIFKIDGEPIAIQRVEMALYYREGETSLKINEFNPVFPDLSELKNEVEIIMDEFSDKDSEVKVQEITAYLAEFYGKPQKENLTEWLEKNFTLK